MSWTFQNNGTLIWPDECKLVLLQLMKKYPIVLSDAAKDRVRAGRAWQKIYIELTKRGMPEYSVQKIRVNIWHKLRAKTLQTIERNKRSKSKILLSQVQSITKELLDNKDELLKMPSVSRRCG